MLYKTTGYLAAFLLFLAAIHFVVLQKVFHLHFYFWQVFGALVVWVIIGKITRKLLQWDL